jgi:hypothetical protein
MLLKIDNYFLSLVDIPNGKYKGQKLIRLVKMNIPAKANKTIATVPEMISIKYRMAIAIATTTRRRRSILPIFGFITV